VTLELVIDSSILDLLPPLALVGLDSLVGRCLLFLGPWLRYQLPIRDNDLEGMTDLLLPLLLETSSGKCSELLVGALP
jgi:hypothetical protein